MTVKIAIACPWPWRFVSGTLLVKHCSTFRSVSYRAFSWFNHISASRTRYCASNTSARVP